MSYLFWQGRPALVRDAEIKIIKKWLGTSNHEDIDINEILPGDYVRITSGKLMGEEGLLLDRTRNRSIVQIKQLGLQISLSHRDNHFVRI